jgi:hypothetical protein
MRRPSSCFDLTDRGLLTHILLLHHFGEAEPAQAFAQTDRQSGEVWRGYDAAPNPLHLPLLLDASNYTREGRGAKMVGARGGKSQCDIGKFDVATARDFYHQR